MLIASWQRKEFSFSFHPNHRVGTSKSHLWDSAPNSAYRTFRVLVCFCSTYTCRQKPNWIVFLIPLFVFSTWIFLSSMIWLWKLFNHPFTFNHMMMGNLSSLPHPTNAIRVWTCRNEWASNPGSIRSSCLIQLSYFVYLIFFFICIIRF